MWGHGAAILVENEQAIVAQEAVVREGMGWRAIGPVRLVLKPANKPAPADLL